MIASIVKDWINRSNKLERLWLLAKIEFKLRYYENKLGLLWALIKPLMDIAIYYTVFQVILKQGVPAFASYLFIGLILWNFFVESTTGTVQILHVKKYLYEYSNMNKLEIYLSTIVSNSIGFFFNFLMFLLFYSLIEKQSTGLSFQNFWIIPLFVNLFLLALGMSLILSNIYIVAKDIHQIWTVFVSMLFFLSPIFYKLNTFKEALPSFEYANPIAGIIINARKVMMEHTRPGFKLMAFDFIYALILLLIGLMLLNRLGSKAAEKL
ncbi:ABC transporter permease [Flavitalea sp. BT771]|uniref:ABC transporter permease n=1 Tax=Flavitalea sp. BT771 TaxID=3063329 RepID=UPI0026E23173|nr:ABC transporter permease [Flavitalea sp. BT771]MDO6432586.1 ABC transporter permease [Flavitalea sp. BT771]MDV6222138.1 ABC transporter permease [Flavitalea sp. BT771]